MNLLALSFLLLFCSIHITQSSEKASSNSIVFSNHHKKNFEKFYVFDVGQGNSQLAIYNNIGILYDCGSMSRYVFNKVQSLQSQEGTLLFSSKKHTEALPILKVKETTQTYEEIGFGEINFDEISETRDSHDTTSSTSGAREHKKSVENKIKEIINNANLSHLIVFISHPDSDHYNMLLSVLPDNITTTVFLCGDWLGGDDLEKSLIERAEPKYTKQIKFIQDLRSRPKTWIELPYYWQYRSDKNHLKNYEDIIDSFKDTEKFSEPKSSHFKDVQYACFKSSYLEYPFNNAYNRFQGSLRKLMERIGAFDAAHNRKRREHFQFFSHEEGDILALNNTFIWIMNQSSTDPNTQSTLISFKMDSLKTIFTCTGDASQDIFLNHYDLFNIQNTLIHPFFEEYLKILIGPHHGSKNNLSFILLKTFLPNIIIFSSGDGFKEKHPEARTINYIKEYFKQYETESQKFSFFFDIGEIKKQVQLSGIYFTNPPKSIKKRKFESTTSDPISDQYNENKVINHLLKFYETSPILCTNLLGTLIFDTDGISCSFSDLILGNNPNIKSVRMSTIDANAIYRVNLKKSISLPIDESQIEYYFQVPLKLQSEETSYKYYPTEKISNGFTPITNHEIEDNEVAIDEGETLEQWDMPCEENDK